MFVISHQSPFARAADRLSGQHTPTGWIRVTTHGIIAGRAYDKMIAHDACVCDWLRIVRLTEARQRADVSVRVGDYLRQLVDQLIVVGYKRIRDCYQAHASH